MDRLISLESTGPPNEFAEKIGIKRSSLFEYLKELKILGVEIKYSQKKLSYYYSNNKRIRIGVEDYSMLSS